MPNGNIESLAVLALCIALGALALAVLTSGWLASSRRALRLIALGLFGLAGLSLIALGGAALFFKNPSLIDLPLWYQMRGQVLGDRDLPVSLRLDSLSGLSLGVIGVIGFALTLSLPSMFASSTKTPRALGVSFGLLWLGAVFLCVSDHSLLFLFGWELWSAGVLVGLWSEQDIRWRALWSTQIGALLLLVSFALLSAKAGDIGVSFREWREGAPVRGVIGVFGLLMMVASFALMFGVAPFHRWAAEVHQRLPLPSTSLMVGAAPAILFCVAIRLWAESGLTESFWGVVLLWYGAFSAVLVSFYALLEKSPRRIVSYAMSAALGLSIACLGVGASGVTTEKASLAALGYTAALYYALSVGLALGVLYLAVGRVSAAVSHAEIGDWGGLHKTMPKTTLVAVLGGAAVIGLPPFGAFVGLWFLLQSLFSAPRGAEKLFLLLGTVGVALAFSLLLFSLLRLLGAGLLGVARSARASEASESKGTLRGTGVMLGVAMALGLSVGPFMGKLQIIIEGITGKFEVPMSAIAIELNKSRLAPLTMLIVVCAVGFLSFIVAKRGDARRRARSKATSGDILTGGLHPDSLSQPLRHFLRGFAQISASRVADPDETPQQAKPFEYRWEHRDRLDDIFAWRPSPEKLDVLLRWLQPQTVGSYLVWLALIFLALLLIGR